MNKINFLNDYPESKNVFKLFASRVQEFSSLIKMEYKRNHTRVKMNKIFSPNELKKITFYFKKLYEYALAANKEGYAPIEFGDSNIPSGEYQWSTEADFIGKIEDGYLPLIKDGTSTVNAFERARTTPATGTSTEKVIIAIFHSANKAQADREYHAKFEDMGYFKPNDRKLSDKNSIPGGAEWFLGIDPFTKQDVISHDVKENISIYHPSTPQKRVRELVKDVNDFIQNITKEDPYAVLKLAIFLKCRTGKTPAFLDIINQSCIDYCIFVSRRVAVSYEVHKNINEFFESIESLSFNDFTRDTKKLVLKTVLTTTVQSFEDDSVSFDDDISNLKDQLNKIKPYVNNLVGCLVLDEAQIGGATEKMKIFVKVIQEILGIKVFMDLSGTPSKLYALKEYDYIIESDLLEEDEIRRQQYDRYGLDHKTLNENLWD